MLRLWLQELKNNTTAKKALCLNDNFIDEFIKEYDEALIPKVTFVEAIPIDDPKIRTDAVNYYIDGGIINRPTCVRKVGDEWWIGSYSATIAKFDENFSYIGSVGIGGNPNTTNFYGYTYGFCVDIENDRLVIACYGAHRVVCYQLSTMQLLWKSGTGSAGSISSGALQNPVHVEFLPNGNVLVSCYRGIGQLQDGTVGLNYGHITELDINDGHIIASRLIRQSNGLPWNNSIQNPSRFYIDKDDSKIYVCTASNYIGVWDISTWEYVTVYAKPRGLATGALGLFGVYVDKEENEIVGGLGAIRKLAALDLTTHDFKWACGTAEWDDRSDCLRKPGTLMSVYDIEKFDSSYYLVADYANNRIMYIPKSDYVKIKYQFEIPENYEVIERLLPKGFDLETKTMTFKLCDYEKQNLLIPIRRCE